MKFSSLLLFSVLFLILLSCKKEENTTTIIASDTPNILFIIADDMGKDATNGFSEGIIKPNTPTIDNIKNTGLSFSNFWVAPTCSPTRAATITGKYGYQTGVKWAGDVLSNSETVLQKYINDQTNNQYATAVIGKWHLAGSNTTFNPENFGIDYYAGMMSGTAQSYYNWDYTENGTTTTETEYITEKFTNLAIDWVNQQDKPWFLWLAYTAPHTPFHAPPTEMHSQGNLPPYTNSSNPIPYYMAAIETMDYQIDRLLSELSEEEKANTIIIFIGDNGTPNQVAQTPYSSRTTKGTLYEGGINCPLFVTGKGVSRTGTDTNLINTTDLFATIAQIAGSNTSEINDSKSFNSLFTSASTHREYIYSEMNDGTDDIWAIRNQKYKIIANNSGSIEMYNLEIDPYENTNLLLTSLSDEENTAKNNLEIKLNQIRN
ncbi:arylsulfatase A family protein [Bernardetia litoralis DSM 6794]|uniref:Arylsulfatase A family protein n=1 Tax=Bernardetia litoralis (strain ATCC 23117 / DSM 6794 / NBRC 15988 / NCIMB 1366 / Fx l1 / Sio-4) TaxID=880071 RepID=I4AJX4_BERLS|nr:sulfatase-like hydrolase/transferase [Bernardetia litoralis]AFM04259.1 arylsulfatase A family protein [Bernardetia litoralis DSM 6794]